MIKVFTLYFYVERDLGGNKLEEWKGDINRQLPSLTTLDISGNTNWTITENMLNHKTLRTIKGVSISADCTVCSLVRNHETSKESGGDTDVIIQESCVKYKYIFNKKHQVFTRHQFFPQCIRDDTRCVQAVGRVETEHICLEVGKSILISAFPIGILSFFFNLIVLVVIVASKSLRSNASLLLVSSMCASGVLNSVYSVAVAAIYQITPVEKIEGKRVSMCQSIGFIASLSLTSMIIISLAVTVERYLAVVYCMKLHIRLRVKQAYYLLLITWLVAFIMGGWSLADPNIYSTKGYETYICLSIQSVLEKKYLAYTITAVTIGALCYLPTIPLYVHIFLVVRKSGNNFGIKREAILARRIFLLVGSNVVFMAVPMCLSHIAIATGNMVGFSETSKFIVVTCTKVICMSINALLNPILYGYRNERFKKALRKSWECFRNQRVCNKQVDREATPRKRDKIGKQNQRSLTQSTKL